MTRRAAQSKGTKKEMIARMLLDRNNTYTAREIAREVGTTEGNVFKEKSKMKAIGTLTNQRLSVFSRSVGDEILTLAHAEAKTLITHSDSGPLTNIPPMNQDDLKKMYSEFQGGKNPIEVIAENGFSPKLVEYEYIRFCRLNGMNLKALASELTERFSLGSEVESEHLIQKVMRGGNTSNEEIKKMFDLVSSSSYVKGELSVIQRMRNSDSVGTFKPFVCRICQRPIRGALIEFESELGRKITESMGTGNVHDKCLMGMRQ